MLLNDWDIWCGHICDDDYWCLGGMMYEKYAYCDICLMIGYGWIVGWTMLMVNMILIMYNDGKLELVLLGIGMRNSIWYVNMFEFKPLGWSGLKWWDSDFVYCGNVSMCELRRLDVEFDTFWLISNKRDEIGIFWLILERVENGLFWKWHIVVLYENMVFGHTLAGHNLDYGSPFCTKSV